MGCAETASEFSGVTVFTSFLQEMKNSGASSMANNHDRACLRLDNNMLAGFNNFKNGDKGSTIKHFLQYNDRVLPDSGSLV